MLVQIFLIFANFVTREKNPDIRYDGPQGLIRFMRLDIIELESRRNM